jgi:hypothetical protein
MVLGPWCEHLSLHRPAGRARLIVVVAFVLCRVGVCRR